MREVEQIGELTDQVLDALRRVVAVHHLQRAAAADLVTGVRRFLECRHHERGGLDLDHQVIFLDADERRLLELVRAAAAVGLRGGT